MIVRRIANKIIAIISLILSFVPAAGAGAAENRRGAGEHPRVCEDEEQPAPDQAGDRRRGTNHLKNKIKEPAGVVWVRLIVRMFCGAQSRQERVWWCWWWWWPPDRGLEMNFPNLAVPFPAVRRETLQTKDTPPPPPSSVCLPRKLPVLTSAPHSHPAAAYSYHPHPLQEGPNTDMLHAFQWRASELPMSSDGDKHTNTHTHAGVFIPSVSTPLSTTSGRVSLYCYRCCHCCCFFLFFILFSSSESKKKIKEKWTLDGLLKLCNVKAKQMCFFVIYVCSF